MRRMKQGETVTAVFPVLFLQPLPVCLAISLSCRVPTAGLLRSPALSLLWPWAAALASQSWAWWSPLPRAPGCRFSAAELLFCTGRQSWNTCHCEHLLSSHMNICEQRKNRQRVGADTIIATDLQFSKENCSFHYCHLNIDEWVQNQQRKFLVLYMYKLRVCLGNYICPFSVFFLCYCKLF